MSRANPRAPQAIVAPLSNAFRFWSILVIFMEHFARQHLLRLGLPSLRKYREQ